MRALAILLALSLAAPAPAAAKPSRGPAAAPDWRAIAVRDDLRRLRMWRDAFVEALGQARAAGHGATISREGALLEPDAALDGAELAAGSYRCRTLKLGSAGAAGLAYVAYPAFTCRVAVANGVATLEKLDGSQRPVGRLYPGGARRQVFLGTLVLGDETRALGYGRDPSRDMIGALERIGAQRWRLVLPYPRFESLLDIVELVPET